MKKGFRIIKFKKNKPPEINFRLEDVTNTTTTLSYIKKEIGSSFETCES